MKHWGIFKFLIHRMTMFDQHILLLYYYADRACFVVFKFLIHRMTMFDQHILLLYYYADRTCFVVFNFFFKFNEIIEQLSNFRHFYKELIK